MRKILQGFMLVVLCTLPAVTLAQDQEVPISSREVAERLTRLEEGQKALAQRLEDVNTSSNKRIDDLRSEMNKRFDDMNSRFNDVMTLLQIIISTLVVLVLAVAGAGFAMWRKILAVEAVVQVKIGLDQAVREQVLRLEQEVGFVKGKLQELSTALENVGKGQG